MASVRIIRTSIPKKEKLFTAVIESCKIAEEKMNEFAAIRLIVEQYEEKDFISEKLVKNELIRL